MLSCLDSALSRHADWREDYRIVLDGGAQERGNAVFRVALRPDDPECDCGRDDYGFRSRSNGNALEASTDDGTGRVIVVPDETGFLASWLFPASALGQLAIGAYRGELSMTLPSQPGRATILESFTKVIR